MNIDQVGPGDHEPSLIWKAFTRRYHFSLCEAPLEQPQQESPAWQISGENLKLTGARAQRVRSLAQMNPDPDLASTGYCLAGKPRFDLRQSNEPYFDRLRARVIAARDRGIYLSIKLFEDWIFLNKRPKHPLEQHLFHKDNNVSGVNSDPNGDGWGIEIHTLQVPEVLEIQKTYARKVIDAVNDLDNVLYVPIPPRPTVTRSASWIRTTSDGRSSSTMPRSRGRGCGRVSPEATTRC